MARGLAKPLPRQHGKILHINPVWTSKNHGVANLQPPGSKNRQVTKIDLAVLREIRWQRRA